MKKLWLPLVALLVCVGTTVATVDGKNHQDLDAPSRFWPCFDNYHGCYSIISNLDPQEDAELKAAELIPEQLAQPTLWSILKVLRREQEAPVSSARFQRSVQAATALGRRRKPWERRVCRGCYSGLMILGPPPQGGQNESLALSYSDSSENSSEGN